ncbi:hypothetical protein ACIRRA_05035 [Nocardia sp. NPDC101769]
MKQKSVAENGRSAMEQWDSVATAEDPSAGLRTHEVRLAFIEAARAATG